MNPKSAEETFRLVLGIDPGSAVTGYGLLRVAPRRMEALEYGAFNLSRQKLPLPSRLRSIFEGLEELLARTVPDVIAVESIFTHANVQSALKLAHARGVVLLAAARAGVEVREYTPRQVKMGAVGHGGAEKLQVQEMVRRRLGLPEGVLPLDATDALAVALCEADAAPFRAALAGATGVRRPTGRT
jgi:crossover junction endodeoxyribonuclease RuvC